MERTTNHNVPAYIKPTLSSLRRSVRIAPSSPSFASSLLDDRIGVSTRDFKRSASFNLHRRYDSGLRGETNSIAKFRNFDAVDRYAYLKAYGRRNTTNPTLKSK